MFLRFILENTSDICKGLDNRKIRSQEKIKTIEGQISYWKKGVKETEENIRDMVSQRREK
jgi:chaperonin cofactor prefoldin